MTEISEHIMGTGHCSSGSQPASLSTVELTDVLRKHTASPLGRSILGCSFLPAPTVPGSLSDKGLMGALQRGFGIVGVLHRC